MTVDLILDDIVDDLIEFLGGKCFVCEAEYPDGKSWTIHHRKYRDGEKTSKNFKERIPHIITRGKRKGKKTHKTIYHKQEYYEYLKPIVLSRPEPLEDFCAIHHKCHVPIGRITMFWKKDKRKRLCLLMMEQD